MRMAGVGDGQPGSEECSGGDIGCDATGEMEVHEVDEVETIVGRRK